jgi:hypothetical protein
MTKEFGIGWHRDKPHFDKVFGCPWEPYASSGFRRAGGEKWERFTLEAQPRSLYMISGASRQVWEHSIPTVEAPPYSITLEPWSGERRDPWTPPDRLRPTEDSESNGKTYRLR